VWKEDRKHLKMVASHDEKLFVLCSVQVQKTEDESENHIDSKTNGENQINLIVEKTLDIGGTVTVFHYLGVHSSIHYQPINPQTGF
jgi:hypothetical protein